MSEVDLAFHQFDRFGTGKMEIDVSCLIYCTFLLLAHLSLSLSLITTFGVGCVFGKRNMSYVYMNV
jgi:hypothetical protein